MRLMTLEHLMILTLAGLLAGCNGPDSPSAPQTAAASAGEPLAKPSLAQRRDAVAAVKAASQASVSVPCDTTTWYEDGQKRVDVHTYRPKVIDAKLAFLPLARATLGFSHVSSCKEAERFFEYTRAHPEITDLFDPVPSSETVLPAGPDTAMVASAPPLRKSSIYVGAAAEKYGVVQIYIGNEYCTGSILDSRTIITSAHCVDMGGVGDDFTTHAKILYFDPEDGSSSPRLLIDGNVYVRIHPPWSGDQDYESDISVILSQGGPWPNVDIYDNIRVYNGNPYQNWVIYWGRGYNSISGEPSGSGTLRYLRYNLLDGVGSYYYYDFATSTQRLCHGDSGGLT